MCITLSEHEVTFSFVVNLCSQSGFAIYLAKHEPNVNHSHTKGTLEFGEQLYMLFPSLFLSRKEL